MRKPAGIIADMVSLLTKCQLSELGQLFRGTVLRILTVQHLMVLGMAMLLAVLVGVVDAPDEIVLNFVLDATGAVVALQVKLLLIVGSIGAMCYVVGTYRLDVLASYLADGLKSKIKGLTLYWASMLANVRTPFPLPTAPVLRAARWIRGVGAGAGFVPGHTPQLE